MTRVEVSPVSLRGRIAAPASKSYTHRALLAGYLSGRPYHVHHPNDCEDTRATRDGLQAMGARVELRRNGWTVHRDPRAANPRDSPTVDCHASGTTLRFLAALAAGGRNDTRFIGEARLSRRPIRELLELLQGAGARVRMGRPGRSLPFHLRGPIRGGSYELDASVSSQFVSALLFVLPTLQEPSVLRLRNSLVSAPYVDATVAVLTSHGVRLGREPERFVVPAPQSFEGRQFFVTGDASSAAYLWAAAAVTGGSVTVTGIDPKWPQADLRMLDLLEQMGARVSRHSRALTVRGPLRRGVEVDLTDAPDLYPLVGVLAALAPEGSSLLRGAPQVSVKESDRRKTTVALLRDLGARVRSREGALEVLPGRSPLRLDLQGLTDHRLLMSAAVGALGLRGRSRLAPAEAAAKSFPGFFEALRSLGAEVD